MRSLLALTLSAAILAGVAAPALADWHGGWRGGGWHSGYYGGWRGYGWRGPRIFVGPRIYAPDAGND